MTGPADCSRPGPRWCCSELLLPPLVAAVALPLWLGREWPLLLPYLASNVAVAVPPRLCVPALAGTVGLAYAVAGRVRTGA